MHMHTHTRTRAPKCMHTYLPPTYVPAYFHTYMHTCTHVHIHKHTCKSVLLFLNKSCKLQAGESILCIQLLHLNPKQSASSFRWTNMRKPCETSARNLPLCFLNAAKSMLKELYCGSVQCNFSQVFEAAGGSVSTRLLPWKSRYFEHSQFCPLFFAVEIVLCEETRSSR